MKIKWPWSKAEPTKISQSVTLKWNGVEIQDELGPEDHALLNGHPSHLVDDFFVRMENGYVRVTALIDGQPVASFRTLRSDAQLLEALLNRELFLSAPRTMAGVGGGGGGYAFGDSVVMKAWGGHGSSEK